MTLFERAQLVMPGGVNSPVRSFRAVGREPIFIQSANGAQIRDTQGRDYIDYVCSWGPMILGHNHPAVLNSVQEAVQQGLSFGAPTEREVQMAELMTTIVPNMDMVRMVNSGTEAVMSAIRLARGFTKKQKIIKFDGCYHGHSDTMLVKAGSGALTLSNPDSLGVTELQAKDTLIAQYNHIDSVNALFEANVGQIAAVIIEPVAANMGVVPPKAGFLQALRKLCTENGALLIFDEVITGFRLGLTGAQGYFGVDADIVTFGKIIGGGMPVGAYGARREIMELISPLGSVYQAGTLSGNPVAMAAGLAQLTYLQSHPEVYTNIEHQAATLADGLRQIAAQLEVPVTVNHIGSLVCAFFTNQPVEDFAAAKTSNTAQYGAFFRLMLEGGINLAPAQFEAAFVSNAHTQEQVEKTLSAAKTALQTMKEQGAF